MNILRMYMTWSIVKFKLYSLLAPLAMIYSYTEYLNSYYTYDGVNINRAVVFYTFKILMDSVLGYRHNERLYNMRDHNV